MAEAFAGARKNFFLNELADAETMETVPITIPKIAVMRKMMAEERQPGLNLIPRAETGALYHMPRECRDQLEEEAAASSEPRAGTSATPTADTTAVPTATGTAGTSGTSAAAEEAPIRVSIAPETDEGTLPYPSEE